LPKIITWVAPLAVLAEPPLAAAAVKAARAPARLLRGLSDHRDVHRGYHEIVAQGSDVGTILGNTVDRVASLAALLGFQGPSVLTAALEGSTRRHPSPRTRHSDPRIRRPAVSLGWVRFENFVPPTSDPGRDDGTNVVDRWVDDGSTTVADT
jgi:hypothetical protein